MHIEKCPNILSETKLEGLILTFLRCFEEQ